MREKFSERKLFFFRVLNRNIYSKKTVVKFPEFPYFHHQSHHTVLGQTGFALLNR